MKDSLTIVLRDEVDLDSSERRGALVDRLLGDTGRYVALRAGTGAGGNGRARKSSASGEKLTGSDTKDPGKRRRRAVLDQRCEAHGTGGDADGGAHVKYESGELECRV